MTSDPTQHQSTEAQAKSQDLSRQRTTPPIEVPGYETRQFLGAGAYGEVWVAVDQNTGRRVAIKFFVHRGGVDWSLLSSEVEKLVFLSADRYVVQLLDVGWDSDPPYYVMEYVENGSLEDILRRRGPLSVGESMEIFREVATGLSRAHGKGVLHCDLKPANILLDQDNKPRLADFGQSRLSHEQTPALGTLFFMAPEQADLDAVPDARWDVYALGALLHTMLTGSPPYRSEAAISELDSTRDLNERLNSYRRFIQKSSPSTDIRIKSVDRPMQTIMEGCLAVDPERRYPNVQTVLDAIASRDSVRDRRPLVLLGLVGPLLFLLITSLFAWRGHQQAVRDADSLLLAQARASNGFAADFVAEAVARRIESYFRAVEAIAADPGFLADLDLFLSDDDARVLRTSLRGREIEDDSPERHKLQTHSLRQPLQARMDRVIAASEQQERREIASWFVTDENGIQLASSFLQENQAERSTVGGDYSFRTYFHGAPEDGPTHGQPIDRTHFSTVFQSTATRTWKVAISTPIRQDGRFLGIVALTVELGRLGELLGGRKDGNSRQFNVLVDGRAGKNYGVILQHPLLTQLRDQHQQLDRALSSSERYRVPLSSLRDDEMYLDPLGQYPEGEKYQQRWIAARRNVLLNGTANQDEATPIDTGLVVIVQEDYNFVTNAVHLLGKSLLDQGLLALTSVVLLVILLWYSVARALSDPNETIRRQGGTRPSPTTIHSMETIELPTRLKR